jgi:hypothetical protein
LFEQRLRCWEFFPFVEKIIKVEYVEGSDIVEIIENHIGSLRTDKLKPSPPPKFQDIAKNTNLKQSP